MSNKSHVLFNDPIYGFVTIPYPIIFKLIEHPFFQRLRRINQLGVTHLVYSGAHHTRFHHALGAMHLMGQAIEVLRSKGHEISEEEAEAVTIAILLHDIGHGPFSHNLEHSIVDSMPHEDMTNLFLITLNKEFDNQLSLAIKIFNNQYKKRMLHQLVSSQLDMDRLDYLNRDSFFSGVTEGLINSDRIIKLLNVVDDQLVIDAKGIYSIENFIISRRLMYWQVYLHKTVLSAQLLLINVLKRARQLADKNKQIFCTPALKPFLYNNFSKKDFITDSSLINKFALLDDYDVLTSIKVWATSDDTILATLSQNILNRRLYKIILQKQPFSKVRVQQLKKEAKERQFLKGDEVNYFVSTGSITNSAYYPKSDKINILFKDGTVLDIADAADLLNISVLSKEVKKYYLYYPKENE